MFGKIDRKFVEKNMPDEVKEQLKTISENMMELVSKTTTITKTAILDSGKVNEDGSITIPKEVVDALMGE